MATAGLVNHQSIAQTMAARATPMTTPSSGSNGSTSDDSATISANDFLTLLVTEMQNQDPTADTDPNEYINQLVSVNSLEQLISINQTLSTDLGSSTTTTDAATGYNSASTQTPSAKTNSLSSASAAAESTAGAQTDAATEVSKHTAVAQTPGNLGIPATNSAAQHVAHSLTERTRARPSVAPPVIP